jgi:hypothetical protein
MCGSLSKPAFNCAKVDSRWGGIDCGEGSTGCAIKGRDGKPRTYDT